MQQHIARIDDGLLAGGGEMGAAVRAMDWSATPLGPISTWPQSLRVAVSIVLNSRFPMYVWWGPDLINIYNDAYVPMLGRRHPAALGRRAREIWHEIWPEFGPLSEAVIKRGETTLYERAPLVLERYGYPEQTHFTWSQSPLYDDSGVIGGLLCVCSEDTELVRAERERDRLVAELRAERARLAEVFNRSPSFMCVLRGPDHVFELANDRYYELVGRRDLIGRPVREALPEVEGQGLFDLLDRVYTTGEPFVGSDVAVTLRRQPGEPPEERVCDFVYQPTRGADGSVSGIFAHGIDVTERKRVERRDQLLLALDDAVRPLTDPAEITAAYARLLGEHLGADRCAYADVEADQDTFNLTGDYNRGVPSIVGRYRFADFGQQVLELMRANEPYVVEDVDTHRPPVGDLSAYRATMIRAVVCVPLHKAGRFVAAMAVHQTVPRRWTAEEVELVRLVAARCWESIERARVQRTLREGERQMRLLTDALPALISYVDDERRYRFANRAYSEWFGVTPGQIDGRHLRDVLGEHVYAQRLPYIDAVLRGETVRFEGPTVHRMLGARHTEVLYVPNVAAGRVLGFVVLVTDITDRKRSTDRISGLHAVAAALSEALTTGDVAKVAVEQGIAALGATAGSLSLLSDDGQWLEMMGHVGYPAEVIDRWRRYPLDAPIPLADAVRTAEPVYLESAEERLKRYPALGAVRATKETASSVCLPLIVGGKAVGVLGLSFDRTGAFAAEDRQFILSLGRQCAQALERARLFEAEQRARAEAERASRAKDEFLAVLSHELRTPLTPVLLTVSLIEHHPELPDELREDVAAIRRNVELESRLISDLLDLTRIAKGKLQLDAQDVDLHLIVRAAIDICQREASAKLAVEFRASRHVVRGDATRLEQIFWNLISNAMKFTGPDGTITVRSSDAGDGRVRVEVSDTGAGIDAELMPKLFSAFEQGEVRAARQQAGLGLGLAISKNLAEAHGGTITAHSAGRGHGSTFTVELPTTRVFVPQAAPPRPPTDRPAARPLSVLLVEDNEPTLAVMSKLLRHLGHRVTGATTVASAVAAARRQRFDLLLSDLGLPDGSGLDLMRELRADYAGKSIALTGYGMDSDIRASAEAGFTEHLTKPVDLQQLEQAIRRVGSTG